jgi:hypothetical protein
MFPAISTCNRRHGQTFTRFYCFSVKTRGLLEYILVHLVIETDYQLVTLEDSGSPQVSGSTQRYVLLEILCVSVAQWSHPYLFRCSVSGAVPLL